MKTNKIILICILGLLVSSCSNVQKAFDPQRKNGSDEFLVEKKSPLSMPPEFERLPEPKIKQKKITNKENEVKLLLKQSKVNKTTNTNSENINENFEQILLKKIKKK